MNKYTSYLQFSTLILTGILIYWSALFNGFIEVDDYAFIIGNEQITSLTPDQIIKLFTQPHDYHYVPFSFLIIGLILKLSGGLPFYFHLTSVLLHIANGLLVFNILKKLFNRQWLAFLSAFLFIIHPIHVESIAWAAAIKNPLFAFFFFLSIIFYIHYTRAGKRSNWLFYSLSLISFLISLLSKTTAISLPLILLLIDGMSLQRGKISFAICKRHLPDKLPFILLALPVIWANLNIVWQFPGLSSFSYQWYNQIILTLHNYFFYIFKILIPANLTLYYPPPVETGGLLPVRYYLWAAFTVVVIPLFLYLSKKDPAACFGWMFYTITLLPMLNTSLYIKDITILVADRYAYIPSIGILLVLLSILTLLAKNGKALKSLSVVIGISLSAGWVYKTLQYEKQWKDTITLYRYMAEHQPSSEFLLRLAIAELQQGEEQQAVEHFIQGFQLADDHTIIRHNITGKQSPGTIATYFAQQGKIDYAEKLFLIALQRDSTDWVVLYNLGGIQFEKGNYDLAEQYFQKAYRLNPDDPDILTALAETYLKKGDFTRSRPLWETLLNRKVNQALAQKRLHLLDSLLINTPEPVDSTARQ